MSFDDECESEGSYSKRDSSYRVSCRSSCHQISAVDEKQYFEVSEKEPLQLPIPWPVKPFFNCIIGQYLYQDDDFVTLMRKISILAMLIAGTAGLCTAPWMLYQYHLHNTISDLIMSIALIITAVVFWTGYFSIRVTKQVTDGVIRTLMLTCSTLLWTTVTFCNTGFDEKQVGMSIALMAIILDCGYELPWIMLHMTLLTWFQTYNRSFETIPGAIMLRVPDTRDANGIEKLWLGYMSYLPPAAAIAATFFTKAEQKRQVRVAKKGTDLARNISNELRKYNTDKVRSLIKDSETDDETDQDLVDTFRALVTNLEKYRPFLPNYLFLESENCTSNEDDDDDDEGTIEIENSPLTSRHSSPRGSMRSRQTSRTTSPAPEHTPAPIANPSTAPLNRRTSEATQAGLVEQNHTHVGRNVVLALLNMNPKEWFQHSPTTAENSQNHRVTQFTDLLYEIASVSKASVHSVLGDAVQLSWNATHRVAQPEAKAATFLLKMRKALGDVGLDVSGACCAGISEIHTCFSPKTKQQALFVDALWLPVLGVCSTLARRYDSLMCDSNVISGGAQYEVTSRAIDCLRYIPNVPESSLVNLVSASGSSSVVGTSTSKIPKGAKALPDLDPPYSNDFSSLDDDQTNEVEKFRTFISDLRGIRIKFSSSVFQQSSSSSLPPSSADGGQALRHMKLIYRHTALYELTGFKTREDDEWMYQLQADEEKGDESSSADELVSKLLFQLAEKCIPPATSSTKEANGDDEAFVFSTLHTPPMIPADARANLGLGGDQLKECSSVESFYPVIEKIRHKMISTTLASGESRECSVNLSTSNSLPTSVNLLLKSASERKVNTIK